MVGEEQIDANRIEEFSNMTQRIKRLKERIQPAKYPFCIEKARLITESWKKTEGEPRIIQVAKAQANILDNIPIFIEDNELIVGNGASKPMGVEYGPLGGSLTEEAIEDLRKNDWGISDEEAVEIRMINDYWKGKLPQLRSIKFYDEKRLWPYAQSGVTLPAWKNREELPGVGSASSGLSFNDGLIMLAIDELSIDRSKVITFGLNHFINEAKAELKKISFMNPDAVNNTYYLQAVIITWEAVVRFANRFAALATEMAEREKNPTRKIELERIAQICKWVPANPARTFYEAIQSYWFLFLFFVNGTSHMGRFDQFMYPYYKKDIKEGRITDEDVLELLQCLRIKDMQLNTIAGSRVQREKWAGLAKWNNMVIGGVTPSGEDASNELTYLVLEAAMRCQTPHHTITLRVHEGTPEPLMMKAIELLKTGIGMPAFVGDKSFIEYLLSRNVPLELARDYFLIGCLDANVPEGCASLPGMFIVPLVFDFFIHNGIEPRTGRQIGPKTGEFENYKTFDDLMKAWKEQLKYFMRLLVETINIDWQVGKDDFPDVRTSSLFTNGIKTCKSRANYELPFKLGNTFYSPVGMINVADSLAAIKKIVFDEKKVTLKELKIALDANWKGYEHIRKMCLKAPKYGNSDEYADLIAKDLYKFWVDMAITFDGPRGGKYNVAGISITAHGPGGAVTGATPDGRYAGENLADGITSPAQGKDSHGPTAVIKSALMIDQVPWQSTLLNMKFHPSALNTPEDMRKLSYLIRTYLSLGGKHIQFNVANKNTLVDAQKQPEKHRDLIVRVAGYSAYYVQLTKAIQDDIITRMEFDKAS
jgi:pyruvate formate-lyase/glycerol dehydratase family glycyl radical enzyme